jgi:hypothetical protein
MGTFEIVLRRPSDATAPDVEFLSTADAAPDVGNTIVDGEEHRWIVTLIESPVEEEHDARLVCIPAVDTSPPGAPIT